MSVTPSKKFVDYTREFEDLERRRGRLMTVGDWQAAESKSAATLTDDDIVTVWFFAGSNAAADVRARRTAALAPPVVPAVKRASAPVVDTAAAARLVDALDAALEAAWEKDDATALDAFMHEHRAMPVSLGVLHNLTLRSLLAINKRNRERQRQIDQLVEKVEALEQHKVAGAVSYAGVFDAAKVYEPGQLVTKRGLWLCLKKTSFAPGDMPACWRLICKERGVDQT